MIDFLVYVLTIIGLYGLLALSLNVQYGFTGLVNLGQVVFFMIGGYVSAIVVVIAGGSIPLGMLAGTVTAGLFGGLMALPTAQLKADYWAIASLAVAELVRIFFLNVTFGSPYTGAAFGISGIDQPLRAQFTSPTAYGWFYFALVACAVAVCYLVVSFLSASPFGRALKAIREDDNVALAMGKDARWLRIRAMIVGGAIGGLAGALFAHFNAFISPKYFQPITTFIVWGMVILGGAGNYRGVLVGAIIMEVLYNSTRFIAPQIDFIDSSTIAALRLVAIGIFITVIVMYLPRGLFPERRRRYGPGPATDGH